MLRRATMADLDAIYDLEVAGFAAGIVEELAVFAQRIQVFPEGFLVLEPAAHQSAAARLDGYLCCEIWQTPGDQPASSWPAERFHLNHDIGAWLDRTGPVLYIASMTVAPGLRGSGLGKLLFRQAMARMCGDFPKVDRAVLIVNEHWIGARRIYAGEGFVVTGQLPAFFRPDSGPSGNAIIMERRIDPRKPRK